MQLSIASLLGTHIDVLLWVVAMFEIKGHIADQYHNLSTKNRLSFNNVSKSSLALDCDFG